MPLSTSIPTPKIFGNIAVATLALALCGTSFAAQNGRKQPDTDICVAKNLNAYDVHGYTTVQAAVNAANSGQIIEILDEGVYEEQITIDGREVSAWAGTGIKGGKNGITLRYVPQDGARAAWNHPRPTIRYRDIGNTDPNTKAKAEVSGELFGASGNFETCGALRILHAKGVTVEGIAIDGISPFAFGAKDVWHNSATNRDYPLFHGNAAVTLAVSGGVTIRDCDIRNAYFGIYIKDRNDGGAFGNKSVIGPSVNEVAVPLSGFGNTGGHLFEYNKVGANVAGFFFESAYDLGSTARYNLIYDNKVNRTIAASLPEANKQNGGAFMFKDMYLSPVAVYNNTFSGNTGNFLGNWQAGGQHLIFNNIFGASSPGDNPGNADMSLDDKFPFRMSDNIFTGAGAEPPFFKSLDPASPDFLAPEWGSERVQEVIRNKGWAAAGIRNGDGTIADLGAVPFAGVRRAVAARIVPTGLVLLSGAGGKAGFNIKLESGAFTDMGVKMLRWIAPIPDNKQVCGGQGDPQCESGGDWPDRMRIVPADAIRNIGDYDFTGLKIGGNTGVFRTEGAAAEYGFFELIIQGKDANGNAAASDVGFLPYRKLECTLKIEVLDAAGAAVAAVTAGERYSLRVTAQRGGVDFTEKVSEVAYGLLSSPTAFMYTDPAPGNPLVYDADAEFPKTYPSVYFTRAGPNETVSASGIYASGGDSLPIVGTLDIAVRPGAPAKTAFLAPLPKSQGVPASTINRGVHFEARIEVQDRYGNAVNEAAAVSVRSGEPEKGNVGASASSGSSVNATSPAVTAVSDPKTGVVSVYAFVTGGNQGEEFDLIATLVSNGAYDAGSLRVGRLTERLEVYYYGGAAGDAQNTEVYDIDGMAGEWFRAAVKLVGADDKVITSRNGSFVRVDGNKPGLVFSAVKGGAPATVFPLTDGIAVFYVSADADVFGGCLNVPLLRGNNPADIDGTVIPGNRCAIRFRKPMCAVMRAAVYGDGHGRPDSLLLYYAATGGGSFAGDSPLELPDSVTLAWPSPAGAVPPGALITAYKSDVSVVGDTVLCVNLTGGRNAAVPPAPTGHTSIVSGGRGLVKVYGGAGRGVGAVEEFFDVLDGIGPVLSDGNDRGGCPRLMENLNPGAAPDTLVITLSEELRNLYGEDLVGGNTLLYTKEANPGNDPASGGAALNVLEALPADLSANAYRVVVEAVPDGLRDGDWIRLNPDGPLVDRGGRAAEGFTHPDNKAQPNNRWVRLDGVEARPAVVGAYYTANPATGKVDYAYVEFNKAVDVSKWFAGVGGYVKIGADSTGVTAENAGSLFPSASGKTLTVNLAEAYGASQSAVRTSGEMPVVFGYVSDLAWGWAVAAAADRAAPVLADTVFLKMGPLSGTGEKSPDTLIAIYSERPNRGSIDLRQPVAIFTGGGECRPILSDPAVSDASAGGYYRVVYLIKEGDMACAAAPRTGDMVRIDSDAGVGDDEYPPNIQEAEDNLAQPLKVVPGKVKWKAEVKNNPFRSGPRGGGGVTVSLIPGIADSTYKAKARIFVFDNLGALVFDTSIAAGDGKDKAIRWRWNGCNKKGRFVGSGAYLFKALCEAEAAGGGVEDKPQTQAVTRLLGVVKR